MAEYSPGRSRSARQPYWAGTANQH